MKCPKCEQARLQEIKLTELAVDHCDACGGLWCDQSELPRLLELEADEVHKLRRGRQRSGVNAQRASCPRCDTELLRVASALNRQVMIDKCTDCGGVWLDGGEFDVLYPGKA